MRRTVVRSVFFAGTALAFAPVSLAPVEASRPPEPRSIRYELTHDPAAARWRISLRAAGMDAAAGEVSLVLQDWGEWTRVDSYHLRELRLRPPGRPDPEARHRYAIEIPADWDGTLEAAYVVPLARAGSLAQQSHELLPRHDDGGDAAGFSVNTLFEVHQGGEPLEAVRAIRFAAPAGATIATGWGGISSGIQEVRLEHPIDNAPIAFGGATGLASAEGDGLRYEIAQFGPGPDRAGEVLRIARALVPLYGRHSGRFPDEPVRIFLTPLVSGGTHTDHGSIVHHGGDEVDGGLSPESVRVLAHELFHDWLGGRLRPPDDESLVWFHEGFTEYFALWHVAASGLLGREWFADRVAAADAATRGSEAYGKVAFSDPAVRWRDGNGPNETLGYRGGALLAFLADVELRRLGRPGLMQVVADLSRGGDRPLTLAGIRGWMESNGLAEFYERYVAAPAALPEAEAALREIGFETFEREANLTYLGIQLEGDGFPGTVSALDPDGPAARAGFRVGDRIFGYSPARVGPPRVPGRVTTPYRFGLERIATGAKVARLDVLREGNEIPLSLEPRLVPGGVRTGFRASRDATDRFFRFDPQGAGR